MRHNYISYTLFPKCNVLQHGYIGKIIEFEHSNIFRMDIIRGSLAILESWENSLSFCTNIFLKWMGFRKCTSKHQDILFVWKCSIFFIESYKFNITYFK